MARPQRLEYAERIIWGDGVSPETLQYSVMARPPRLELPEGVYHVVVRGNERAAVIVDARFQIAQDFRIDSERVPVAATAAANACRESAL